MTTFRIGEKVYASDWCYGQIVAIEGTVAYVQFETQRGGGCMEFDLSELKHEKWCITTDNLDHSAVQYLGWQKPAWNESGYFWTSKEVLERIINTNNTSDHPFLFNGRRAAIKHLKTLHLPQKCRVVRWY